MADVTQQLALGGTGVEYRSRRLVALIAALALVLGGLVLATSDAEAATAATGVAVVADGGGLASVAGAVGQIDTGALIRAIVCPILARIAANFGPLVIPIVASLRARFGCASP